MPDFMSREKRSYVMSCIRSKNTRPEKMLRSLLHRSGLRFRIHDNTLPGKPDILFKTARVVIFVDGDFWHGWRFPQWENKLPPYWKKKIRSNRRRDRRNHAKLRRLGWEVIRVWEHQLLKRPDQVVARIQAAVRESSEEVSTG